MPYVNFKEERYSANIQIEKRKKNNKKVIDYITKNTQKVTDYIPCKEYSFKKFDGVVFGNIFLGYFCLKFRDLCTSNIF